VIRLTLREPPPVPLEAESIAPDALAGRTVAEIRALPVYVGRRTRRLDEHFDVEGEPGEAVHLDGDLSRVKWIGRGMSRGRISIAGNAGMHLGAGMSGGTIEVGGDAGDWLGAGMSGGLIRVRGNAGGQVGAAYRGDPAGMTDGTVLVHGTAGLEVGMRMKRGLIVVGGQAGDFAGLQMKGGTIVLACGAGLRTGAWMIRGTIVSLVPVPMLPTFAPAATGNPTVMRLLGRHLAGLGWPMPYDEREGSYLRYTGDAVGDARGEILVWMPR
jgi:formylmethanofuran dehydrogenase subunit C